MTRPLLEVDGLSVHVGATPLLQPVSFTLGAGDALTVIGESGAGKSLLAQAVMGNLAPTLWAGGSIVLDGESSRADEGAARRPRWGRTVTLLPQEPALALDPLMGIERQLAEVHALVRRKPGPGAKESLAAIGLGQATHLYPWQLSGGMAQRAAATIALAGGAPVLLVDEPTKGLDAAWRDHTVALLNAVRDAGGCVIAITHDLRVARAVGGRTMVLRGGVVVEEGDTATVLANPRDRFTQELIAADPAGWPRRPPVTGGAVIVGARQVEKSFGDKRVLDPIDLAVHAGDRLVVQGPSGVGKSTLGNLLLGLLPPDRGVVTRAEGLAPTALQKLYQDPVGSFAPTVPVGIALRDVARRHGRSWLAVVARLHRLGVPNEVLERRPAEVSGGELQRVALARVLAVEPAMIFADEPTSRLDPVTQRQSMEVLLDAIDDSGAGLLLVTHDADIAAAVGGRFVRLEEPRPPSPGAAG